MTTCLGKSCSIRFTASAFHKLLSIYVFSYFPFGFEGRIWDLMVSVPDHCLSFYFSNCKHSHFWHQIKGLDGVFKIDDQTGSHSFLVLTLPDNGVMKGQSPNIAIFGINLKVLIRTFNDLNGSCSFPFQTMPPRLSLWRWPWPRP